MQGDIVFDVVQNNGQLQAVYPEARFGADSPVTDRKPQVTQAELPPQVTQGYRWAPWGQYDCLPTDMREKIYKANMAAVAVERLVKMMYGNGLAYYRNSDLQEDPTTAKRHYSPKIEEWLRRNRINTMFLIAQMTDYRMYIQSFCEMILNRRKDLITGIFHKSAEFCRLSVRDDSSQRSEYLYYSPYFAMAYGPPPTDKIKQIPLYNWYEPDTIQKTGGYKFAWHSRFETPGILYYARPWWLGLFRQNGWIDVSIAVPEVVNAMMRNQVMLKYQICIPESYFTVRYPDWMTYSFEQRETKIDDLITKINQELSDTDNLYKSIATVFRENELNGNSEGKIEIIAIDDKLKRDSWVPSSNVSDAQIVQSLGLHPSQVGLAPESGKMGAGSGSDQRESFNTGITLNTLDQQIVLEPLNFVADFNSRVDPEWDITFYIDHTFHTTTNKQETGLEPAPGSLNVE